MRTTAHHRPTLYVRTQTTHLKLPDGMLFREGEPLFSSRQEADQYRAFLKSKTVSVEYKQKKRRVLEMVEQERRAKFAARRKQDLEKLLGRQIEVAPEMNELVSMHRSRLVDILKAKQKMDKLVAKMVKSHEREAKPSINEGDESSECQNDENPARLSGDEHGMSGIDMRAAATAHFDVDLQMLREDTNEVKSRMGALDSKMCNIEALVLEVLSRVSTSAEPLRAVG